MRFSFRKGRREKKALFEGALPEKRLPSGETGHGKADLFRGYAATNAKELRNEKEPSFRLSRCLVLLLLFFAPFLLYRLALPFLVVESPGVLSLTATPVVLPHSGKVIAVGAQLGSFVQKGDLLFLIDEDVQKNHRKQIASLIARLNLVKDTLNSLEENDLSESLKEADSQKIVLLKRALREKRTNRKLVERLLQQKAATRRDLESAWEQERQAEEKLARLQKASSSLLLPRSQDIDAFRREKLRLEEEIKAATAKVLIKRVEAPASGCVQEIYVRNGEFLVEETPLALIVDLENPRVVVFADKSAFPFFKPEITPDVEFPGGWTLPAFVDRLVGQTWTLLGRPASLEDPPQRIRALLTLRGPVPRKFLVEGLPLTVRWGLRGPAELHIFMDEAFDRWHVLTASGLRYLTNFADKALEIVRYYHFME